MKIHVRVHVNENELKEVSVKLLWNDEWKMIINEYIFEWLMKKFETKEVSQVNDKKEKKKKRVERKVKREIEYKLTEI